MKGHDQLVLTDPERAAEPIPAPDLVGRPVAVANETARDQGLTLANVTDDWDGQARPIGSAPDVGADEFGGTVAAPFTTNSAS